MSAGPLSRPTPSSAATTLRVIGHMLPAVLSVGNLVAGVASLAGGLPFVLTVTLLVSGILIPVLAWFSYRRSRAAWAFLVAMTGVFAVLSLFGGPRIAATLSTSLQAVLIIPVLFAAATVVLIQLRDDYVERDIGLQ
jgi:hypothetical protein